MSEPTTVTTPATYFSIGRQTLTVNVDFTVDPGNTIPSTSPSDGRIARIATGALVDGEQVKTSFTHVTFTSQQFGVAVVGRIEGSARIVINPISGNGRQVEYTIPKCQIQNNGDMDLDDSDFMVIPLSLIVLDNSDCDPVDPLGVIETFPIV